MWTRRSCSDCSRALADVDADLPMPSRMCRACVDVLGAQSGAVVVSATPDERLTVSTSDGMCAEIEDLEQMLGEGPGRVAFAEDRIVVADLDADRPPDLAFPLFSSLVGGITGPATSYAVPMRVGGRHLGVLTLYMSAAPTHRDPADLQFVADAVGQAVVGDVDSLDWSFRAQVHQAAGMVTAQLRIPPADALAVLRAHAFAASTSLDAVANDVLARRLTFTQDGVDAVDTDRTEER